MVVKAFYVQVLNRDALKNYSNSQFIRKAKFYPNRGNIYDRHGTPLALNMHRYSIFTIPRLVKNKDESYQRLGEIVKDLSYKRITKRIANRKNYTWLIRKVPLKADQVSEIKGMQGIFVEEESKRYYPNNELASQTLGFVGVDNIGLAGIEYQFDKDLRGEEHIVKYYKDAKGRPIKFEATDYKVRAKDISLSIDTTYQGKAEKYLKEAVLEHKADGGGIAVMDARTGEILAMANYPTYDPNQSRSADYGRRKLSFISDPFEPGSIFKVVTAASALKHGVIQKDSNYYCEKGRLRVGNHVIKEAGVNKGFEWLSVEEIIKYSSNIGTAKMAFDLTFPRFRQSLREFNIDRKTGVELPGESNGILTQKTNVTPLSLSNMSFGQGIATTALQMLSFYAALANGGQYVKPTIIRKDEGDDIERKRILDKKHVNVLTDMLIKVVDEGTGSKARIPYYVIAGKTSTAQRVSPKGGYEGYVGSFIGYPVNVDKKFVIMSYIDNPKGKKYYGNDVAGPMFNKMASYILYQNKETKDLALNNTYSKNLGVDRIKIKHSATKRFVSVNKVPNFIGLDKVSARDLGEKFNFKLRHDGFGVIVFQFPAPGSKVQDTTFVKLKYKVPKYE